MIFYQNWKERKKNDSIQDLHGWWKGTCICSSWQNKLVRTFWKVIFVLSVNQLKALKTFKTFYLLTQQPHFCKFIIWKPRNKWAGCTYSVIHCSIFEQWKIGNKINCVMLKMCSNKNDINLNMDMYSQDTDRKKEQCFILLL